MSEIRFPMKIVTQRTGLSSHVVRVWERRYEAVKPDRSGTNRRLYSEDEILRLELLGRLTSSGHAIRQIASLPTETLFEMVDKLPAARVSKTEPSLESPTDVEGFVDHSLQAVENLDSDTLRDVLDQASVKLGGSRAIENVIVPLIAKIGERWEEGNISVAQEHAASAVIKEVLSIASRPHSESSGAPTLTVVTPVGQLHELGAALVACMARRRGWLVSYLGSSLPAEEIASAVNQRDSLAVALSIVYPGDDAELPDELRRLRRLLPDDFPILVGGRQAEAVAYSTTLDEIAATRFGNLDEFKKWLDEARAKRLAS